MFSNLGRKLSILAAALSLVGALMALPASVGAFHSPCEDVVLSDPRNPDKVSLCHFTGGTNFVLNEVSQSALQSHLDHHGDCYKLSGQPQVCIA